MDSRFFPDVERHLFDHPTRVSFATKSRPAPLTLECMPSMPIGSHLLIVHRLSFYAYQMNFSSNTSSNEWTDTAAINYAAANPIPFSTRKQHDSPFLRFIGDR